MLLIPLTPKAKSSLFYLPYRRRFNTAGHFLLEALFPILSHFFFFSLSHLERRTWDVAGSRGFRTACIGNRKLVSACTWDQVWSHRPRDCRTDPERRSRYGQVRREWLGKSNNGTRKQSGSKTKEHPDSQGEQKSADAKKKVLQNPCDHFSRIVFSNVSFTPRIL